MVCAARRWHDLGLKQVILVVCRRRDPSTRGRVRGCARKMCLVMTRVNVLCVSVVLRQDRLVLEGLGGWVEGPPTARSFKLIFSDSTTGVFLEGPAIIQVIPTGECLFLNGRLPQSRVVWRSLYHHRCRRRFLEQGWPTLHRPNIADGSSRLTQPRQTRFVYLTWI